MVLSISNFLSSRKEHPIQKRPLLNSIPYLNGKTNNTGNRFNYKQFWHWFQTRPEVVGIISLLTTDIIGDRPEFVSPDGKPLGRNKRLQAEKFWKENRVKETVKAILFDMFVTGDGYGWIGRLSADQRNAKLKEIVDIFAKKTKLSTKEASSLFIKATQDEDLKKPKKFDYIASSTMDINNTYQEILGYTQTVNGINIEYGPEEIIHFRLNTINGMVQGFSPMEALVAELVLLSLVKENMVSFMRNGGAPSKIFVLPDEIASSQNHQFLVQTLQRYNAIENRNGNLVFTGDVKVENLAESPKDMEYETLALYIVSNMALAYNIPVTRIPFLIGKSATSGDSGGLAESGYWNMISEKQDLVEDLLNLQLFEPMGFSIRLNRKYKQDEVREAQVFMNNANTLTVVESIYRQKGKQLSVSKINEILHISEDDLEELSPEQMMGPTDQTAMLNNKFMSNRQTIPEQDNQKRADVKRESANNRQDPSLGV